MKNVEPLSALRRLVPARAAALLAMSLAVTGPAGATDISQTPILASSPAEVKPNIMLLMDASSSMGRTHMPDEVETLVTSPPSIGYKSTQCNALYFNPGQSYTIPKRYTDLPFDPPSFDNAPYAGFGEFYATQDLRRVNLNNAFVAYDNTTLEVQPAVYADPPQAAYYYVYTNSSGVRPDKLDYTSALCRQRDNRRTDPTPDGGTWTRYDVSVRSTEEKANFAIWYSFYRTRLALLKSAASLTFAPLNNTKRVGFITVQPKQTPTSAGIWRTDTNEWPRYLPIDDFNGGAGLQKELWFKKVFSQIPGGASPAREGLARVGRYYGSKEDQINTDMPATGLAAPIKYSCQQNFTIMTTDGYWNGQTETPGPLGGGLNLAGDAKVGQQDGNAADPYSPRPFWDGNADSIRTTVNKTNAYTDNACSVADRYRTQYQTQREVDSLKRDSTVTTKTTVQYYESKSQAQLASFRITRQEKYDFKTTEQFAKRKVWYTEESYKHIKWQEHTLMTNEQYSQRTRQNTVQTFQTVQVDKKSPKTEVQWKTSKTQLVETTTQYAMQKDQYVLGVKQVYMTQFRTLAHQGDDENGTATEGDCVEINGIRCETKITFARQLVDPNLCTTGPNPTVVGGGFLKQTCVDGPFARAYTPTNFCRVGLDPATDTNQWVQTRCDYVVGTPVPQSGPCNETDPSFQGDGPDYFVFTCKRPAANNRSVGVPACGAYPPASDPTWITTTCGYTGPNNYPLRPSPECVEGTPPADAEFVTTTCAKFILFDDFAATCVPNDGSLDPYVRVTCGTEQTFRTAVPKDSCMPGIFGAVARTCPRDPAGPDTTPRAVPGACTNIADDLSSEHYETVCNMKDDTAFVLAGNCRDQVASDPEWTTLDCSRDAPPPTYVDPRLCIADDGTVAPYLHTICATTTTLPRTPVPPSSCPLGPPIYGPGTGTDFVVTHCEKETVNPPTDVPRCTANDGEMDPFIVTTCGFHTADEEVHDCIEGPLPDEDGKQVTCVKPGGANNAAHVKVPECMAQEPDISNLFVRVTCEGQTIDPATVSNSADCPVGDGLERSFNGPDSIITCTSTPYGTYAIPAWAAPCTDGRSRDTGTQVETVCSHPDPNNNYVDRAVAPCTEVVDAVGPNEVRTTCRKSTVGPEQVATWQCPQSVAQAGTGPEITCDTHTVSNEPVTSCTENAVNPFPPYETTTRCERTPIETMRDFAGQCIEGPGGNPGEVITCGRRLIDGSHQLDPTCVGPDQVDLGTGIITHCDAPIPSGGHKYFVSTTTTITTQTFSGGLPTANPAGDPPTSTPPVPVDDQCYPTTHDFTSIQPVPPTPPVGTTCAPGPKYPCYTVTATTGGSVNSLADVAQYYYKTDLRPDMTDDPTQGGVPPAGTGPEDDKATHQHMTTFVVGIGVSGTLNYRPDYRTATTGDYADIKNGPTKNWPIWPDPDLDKPLVPCGPPRPNTYQCNESLYNDPRSIDDFWHTAVNGRGRFFSASDPTTVIEGLGDALAQIDNNVASGTAEAVSTLQPTTTNNSAYSTTYTSGVWEGDVQARKINVSDGTLTDQVWSAKDKVGPRQGVACDDRDIYLMRGGNTLVNFTTSTYRCNSGSPVLLPDGLNGAEIAQLVGSMDYDNLHRLTQWTLMTSAQQTAAKDAGRLVNFIRGQRANEGFQIGSLDKIYRRRGKGILFEGYIGDIVNSQPVYVGQPFANYQENNYGDFKLRAREPMLYVGANDGMLHAFYATADTTVANHGQEAWAIIPSAVLNNLVKLADDGYKRGEHQFYVDGTPVAGDVWNGTEWRTILVGGLNAGGKGYYALDVTSPGVLPTPLWEFKVDPAQCPSPAPALMPSDKTGDCNVGLTFGKPIITKLGTEWVVMVTSGYNNSNGATGDGFGYLYVINAMNGKLKYKISTGEGSFSEPSGLAQINNYVDNVDVDNKTLRAYGGDVLGNIFRFEFPPLATEASATLIGIARDPDNRDRQPITVKPELAELDGKPFVIVGTGRLLGGDDVAPARPEALQRQSVYGLRDTLGAGPVFPEPMRPELRPMRVFQSAGTPSASTVREIRCDGTGAECERPRGWVLDLAEVGERVNVEMKLVLGALVFASNTPSLEPCTVGGHSWFNQVDFRTAAPIPGAITSQYLSDSLNVGFNVLQLPLRAGEQNPTYTGLFRQKKGTNINKNVTPPEPPTLGNRISWREIAQ